MRDRKRLTTGILGAVLLLLLGWFLAGVQGSRPPADRLGGGRLIEADTLPDPDAVGLCAVLRTSGVVEGRITGITGSPGTERPRYRIQSLTNPAVEHAVDPRAIRIVSCDELPPTRRRTAGPCGAHAPRAAQSPIQRSRT